MYRFPCTSIRPPRLDVVQSFIVYSDVGDYIHTGDVLSKHLARFPVNAAPGATVSYNANHPSFVPVSRTRIDSIYIQLNDTYGNYPPFSERSDNVVSVKLLFQKRNSASAT